ncbi:MAG: hypothetical protein RB191_10945 [Terriglobia bacterium]|nr:hypothetical protein [Terriglobia bacterium]
MHVFEYQCCLCGHCFDDEQIIAGPLPFESLSPCCRSEDFDLSAPARAHYHAMLKPERIAVMPVSTAGLEEQARRVLERIATSIDA